MTQEDWEYLARLMHTGHAETLAEYCCYLMSLHPKMAFWEVWEWAIKQGWWKHFLLYATNRYWKDETPCNDEWIFTVHSTRFPELVVAFLREREKGEGDAVL